MANSASGQEWILRKYRIKSTYSQVEEPVGKLGPKLVAAYRKDTVRNADFMLAALETVDMSDSMYTYLETVKNAIAIRSGGWTGSSEGEVHDDANLEVPSRYFLKEGHGSKLRDSLKSFNRRLSGYAMGIYFTKLDTDDPPKGEDSEQKTWEEYYWDGVPSIAAITELTKYQNDIRTAEIDVIDQLLKRMGK